MGSNLFGNGGFGGGGIAGNSFNYGGTGFATGVAQSLIDPNLAGANQGFVNNSFSSVLAGITQNAQRGVTPFSQANGQNFTPAQIAGQMQIGGVGSVLPMLGGRFLPKLLFPLAGLWTLVQGVKDMAFFKKDAAAQAAVPFDPSTMHYNQTRASIDNVLAQNIASDYNFYVE